MHGRLENVKWLCSKCDHQVINEIALRWSSAIRNREMLFLLVCRVCLFLRFWLCLTPSITFKVFAMCARQNDTQINICTGRGHRALRWGRFLIGCIHKCVGMAVSYDRWRLLTLRISLCLFPIKSVSIYLAITNSRLGGSSSCHLLFISYLNCGDRRCVIPRINLFAGDLPISRWVLKTNNLSAAFFQFKFSPLEKQLKELCQFWEILRVFPTENVIFNLIVIKWI